MAELKDDSIQLTAPFALPFLGIQEGMTLSLNKSNLQLFMRVMVCVCSALLFWPRIRGAFGFAPSAATEAQTKDIQERIAKIEHEREQKQGSSKKSYAVATGPGGTTPATPALVPSGKDKGSGKRRKA